MHCWSNNARGHWKLNAVKPFEVALSQGFSTRSLGFHDFRLKIVKIVKSRKSWKSWKSWSPDPVLRKNGEEFRKTVCTVWVSLAVPRIRVGCVLINPLSFEWKTKLCCVHFTIFTIFTKFVKIVKIVKGESRNFRKLSRGRHRVGIDTLPYQVTFGNGPRNPTKNVRFSPSVFQTPELGRAGPRLLGQQCLLHL